MRSGKMDRTEKKDIVTCNEGRGTEREKMNGREWG